MICAVIAVAAGLQTSVRLVIVVTGQPERFGGVLGLGRCIPRCHPPGDQAGHRGTAFDAAVP